MCPTRNNLLIGFYVYLIMSQHVIQSLEVFYHSELEEDIQTISEKQLPKLNLPTYQFKPGPLFYETDSRFRTYIDQYTISTTQIFF